MIGEPVAMKGAFLDLGFAVGDGLAHFAGHQRGQLIGALAKDRRGLAHHCRALAEARPPPPAELVVGGFGDGQGFGGGVALVGLAGLAGRRVDGLEILGLAHRPVHSPGPVAAANVMFLTKENGAGGSGTFRLS